MTLSRLGASAMLMFSISIALGAQVPQVSNGADVTGKFFPVEWNTVMVESTYLVRLPSKLPGKQTVGTGFVMGVPIEDGTKEPSKSRPILITAAHVFEESSGDIGILDMRVFENGVWTETPIQIGIRKKGVPLWVQHPTDDVAILDLQNPRVQSHLIEPLVPTDWLASDSLLKDYQIHPGDEVTCLGFPEGITSRYGFPILRTARIASFPILPTLASRPLFLDFPVYKGNSGGPAYLGSTSSRGITFGAFGHIFILGLVIQKKYGQPEQQHAVALDPDNPNDTSLEDMHLAILEPASVINETVNMLPGVSAGHFRPANGTKN